MFTDMVGFAAKTQADEAQALRLLEKHNQLLRPLFARYHGTEVKAIGDSFLVEFDSALEAVGCGVEIQRLLAEYNSSSDEPLQIPLRIGIHLGDVVHSAGDVFGDAVNIASRIEPLAEPGGICVTEPVMAQVRGKSEASFEPLPPSELKNVQSPPAVYRVRWQRGPEGIAPSAAPTAPVHRLAVLPLANLSPEAQDEFFADGLTEELITELARIPGCQVIARTSIVGYKKAPKGIKEVGRELRVDVALEGSVRKSGNRIRVTAQLIDTKSEAHLWAGRFDREFGEIFDLQSEIAARVADALRVELQPRGPGVAGRSGTRNPAAYELYLKGRQYWWQADEASYRTAIRHFEKAIELDPGFALAYCGLADSHALLGNHGHVPLQRALELAEAAARKALALDPNLADAHASLAPVLYNRYDWAGAVAELRRAVELDPNNVLANFWLATALAVQGHATEALEFARRAASLDPLSRQAVLAPAIFLYLARDVRGSMAYMDEVEQRLGMRSDIYRGLCELALGRADVAVEHLRRAASGPFEANPIRRAYLAVACTRAGRQEEAHSLLQKLAQEAEGGRGPAGPLAVAYAALGENDRAFEWFEKTYEQQTVLGAEDLLSDPLMDGIRSDPRFPALLRKFRFAA